MTELCVACNIIEGTHMHHIIPKSRGGGDNAGNLIFLCVGCHSLAHDVSFSGEKGLISGAIEKKNNNLNKAQEWLKEQDIEVLLDKLDLIRFDRDLFKDLLYHNVISALHLYDLLEYGETSIRIKRTFHYDIKRNEKK